LDGKRLIFVAVEGLAEMPNAFPVLVGWRQGLHGLPNIHALKPDPGWTDRPWDDEHVTGPGLSRDNLTKTGTPAAAIAGLVNGAISDHCLVMQQPGLEKPWLAELLVLQPADVCIETINWTTLALLLADHIRLDEDTFINVVLNHWFRMLVKRTSIEPWTLAAPLLIQIILDETIRRGLIQPDMSIELRHSKPDSGRLRWTGKLFSVVSRRPQPWNCWCFPISISRPSRTGSGPAAVQHSTSR
jgi:hypothetical protein